MVKKDDGWYFEDENKANLIGPFVTQAEALTASVSYFEIIKGEMITLFVAPTEALHTISALDCMITIHADQSDTTPMRLIQSLRDQLMGILKDLYH
jgi:hypothetical protein